MTTRELEQRRHLLFTMLTALDYRCLPGHEPALIGALRTWLSGWPGIGRIVAGMSRQGFGLQLARHLPSWPSRRPRPHHRTTRG